MAVTAVLSACDDDDEEAAIAIIPDFWGTQTVNSSSVLYLNFTVQANQADLKTFKITALPQDMERETLVDSVIDGRKFLYELTYRAPQYSTDTTDVTLTISATDVNGNSQSIYKALQVIATTISLTEYGSFSMYTTEVNDHTNGFCFSTLKPIITSLADSADIDIYPYIDENNTDSLTCTWRSNTDINFVRANSFDYANATNRSVTNTYESSTYLPRIQNLADDDIILVGREGDALGVIKILLVDDADGQNSDRYVFSVKVIE